MGPNDLPQVLPVPPAPAPAAPGLSRAGVLNRFSEVLAGVGFEGGRPYATATMGLWLAPQPIGILPPSWFGLSDTWLGFTWHRAWGVVAGDEVGVRGAVNQFLGRIDNSNPLRLVQSLPYAIEPLTAEGQLVGQRAGELVKDTALGAFNVASEVMNQIAFAAARLTFQYDDLKAGRLGPASAQDLLHGGERGIWDAVPYHTLLGGHQAIAEATANELAATAKEAPTAADIAESKGFAGQLQLVDKDARTGIVQTTLLEVDPRTGLVVTRSAPDRDAC